MQENFSPQQSLQVIQSMIQKTKANMSENCFYFLLWGWITLLAIISQFVLKVVFLFRQHYLVWLVTFAGLVLSLLHTRRHKGKSGVRTYIGESMGYLWMGMGISFFILSFIISGMGTAHAGVGWLNAWPFFIMMYGLGTFVSGKILQFRPLVIGGIINWILACGSVYFSFDYQLLFAAAAIVVSYLIPGYLIQSENK